MAEFKPNAEQQQFINSLGRNVLVSASAGSGKTSTMIQKLISVISESRISITSLLVVTYTNAAASEIKQKLFNEINKLISNSNDNEVVEYLKKQLDNLNNAEIGTLHSICKKLIIKYFYEIGQSPDFTLLAEKESKYLLDLAIKNVFRKHITQDDESFYELYDSYNSKRSDVSLKQIVVQLYNYINTRSDYISWKDTFLKTSYSENLDENTSCNYIMDYYKSILNRYKPQIQNLLNKSNMLNLPKYTNFLCVRNQFIDEFRESKSFTQSLKILNNLNLPNKPIKSKTALSEEIEFDCEIDVFNKDFAKTIINLKSNYISCNSEAIKLSISKSRVNLEKLLEIVDEVNNLYCDLKKNKNSLDFGDLEDKMLLLLENQQIRKTLQQTYKYVFVDEYQDINNKQEDIMSKLVSGDNYYMIGDVKQSIYAFRQSSPKIFISKYESYSKDKEKNEVINFNTNYRSDRNILEFCNSVFDTLITEDTVGIDYKSNARFQSTRDFESCKVNLNIISGNDDNVDKEESEALVVAEEIAKILTLTKSDGTKYNYKDIAIIIRSRGTFLETLCRVLTNLQIPISTTVNKEFFETSEIQFLISILKCISNFRDDIAVATILKNLFDLTDAELLTIKEFSDEKSFSECVLKYNKDDNIGNKVKNFFEFIDNSRKLLTKFTLYEVLHSIINKYGIILKYLSLPNGREKESNIQSFLDLINNENYKYNLDKFIEYLEFISKEKTIQLVGNSGNSVQICTIHYSKGLEYPAVILAGLGKKFQLNKDSSNIIINEKFGVGLKGIDNAERIFTETVIRNACKIDNKKSELNEEIRLLYVAMTRAKEHLTLIGQYDLEKYEINKLKSIYSSSNFLDMIFKSFSNEYNSNFANLLEFTINKGALSTANIKIFPIGTISHAEVSEDEIVFSGNDEVLLEKLKEVYENAHSSDTFTIKNTVTNILREESDYELLNFEPMKLDTSDNIPSRNSLEIGTAYHSIMQNLNFTENKEEIVNIINNLIDSRILTRDAANFINVDEIVRAVEVLKGYFINAKKIYKEKQFLLRDSYNNIIKNSDNNTKVIIQGVIDLVIVSDKTILIDYKTNRTLNENSLINQYFLQLQIYKKAFEKATGIIVDKTYLYSFSMGKLIEIN